MGISMGYGSSSSRIVGDEYEATIVPAPTRNPDPSRWLLLKYDEIGHQLVVKLQYGGCTNYEGEKILVFENTTWEQLRSQELIDPHFAPPSPYRHPVARFEPTNRGWTLALKTAYELERMR